MLEMLRRLTSFYELETVGRITSFEGCIITTVLDVTWDSVIYDLQRWILLDRGVFWMI